MTFTIIGLWAYLLITASVIGIIVVITEIIKAIIKLYWISGLAIKIRDARLRWKQRNGVER